MFPLVLYNGDKPWNYAKDLSSLIALPPNSPLQKWQPKMCYYLLDESQHSGGKPGSVAGALFQVENAKDNKAFQDIFRILDELIPSTQASLRRALMVWIRYVVAPYKGLQLDISGVQYLTEVREMLSTRIKQWERDIAEKGIEKGIEKGELLGEAKILTKMLALKFGMLPEWAEQQIAQADTSLLEQWAEKMLDANKLEDVIT